MPATESVEQVVDRLRDVPPLGGTSELVERLVAEGLIGLSAAAKLYGSYRNGTPTTPSAVGRHVMQGVPGPGGSVLKLEAIRLNGRFMTTRQAVLRFFAAQQTPAPGSRPATGALRSPAARTRAATKAAEELERMGA